jgi:hypothetical protein
MANALNQDQLSQIVQAVISALQVQGSAPKAASISAPGNSLEARDRSIVAGFKRRGIADVVLMDRADKSKPFNVKPFRAWLEQGRQVRKGEKSIKGLFHVSQTSELPKPSAKPAVAPEQAQLFAKAKAVFKAKKAKAQPTAAH